jgi:hypothetical protein
MFSDGVLYDTKEFFLGSGRADRHAVEELHHQTSEPLECARNADRWVYFNKDAFGSMNIDLEFASLVDGRIEKGEETLLKSVRGQWDFTIEST